MISLPISKKVHTILLGKEEKLNDIKDKDWIDLDMEAHTSIILCIDRDVTFFVHG